MHVCNFHKLALQASMVFRNIVERCIIQIRPGLWPRTVLRKITDLLPFLAHWAQIFSVWLESQRENWTFYPKYDCKTVAQRLFRRDRSCDRLGQGRGRASGWVAGLGSEAVGWICKSHLSLSLSLFFFANHISNEQWDTIREISVGK